MAFHFVLTIDKTICIGNTLSTINANFTALDTNLYNLSAYTVSSINFLQTEVNFLSTQFQAATAFLQTEVNYLSTQVNFVSSNVIKNYTAPQSLTQNSDGTIDWNFNSGRNAQVTISKSGKINNPTNVIGGDSGNLTITTLTSGALISAFGGNWTVGDASSAFTYAFASTHLISYYCASPSVIIFNVINV